ncbi:MAG: Holliday junction branch migration protein RuvA [Armatimonadetes bacterium]|nr:Holliday junction branch migration protein RuvA [Armatimonadota bacterium]
MIAHIRGTVLKIGAGYVVVDVAGVGYRVNTPASALTRLIENEPAAFHVHTIVKEDAIDLYGFVSELDQQAFEVLISVSGVGPKIALGMLSSMDVRELAHAAQDNGVRLQTIPGVGKKTAQRISLEIGEKLQEIALAASVDADHQRFDVMGDVIEGLIALGYNRADARKAAQDAAKNHTDQRNPAVILKDALNLLNQA